ncbi:trypsin-like peptidase domain-containing protein [Streptomyces sp. SLBN-31]|uniref:trypsin-like peptidase domain-containing protein n=1 Tax=Streptomyces sp. SLBN-31 TaxID=2768444 RepID=UPI001150D736|nr:trypsin-like peptidase domain-containing protein [Streptomyces sp. SLBN-31]TQJ89787.1 putative serine protease PepD [Streptomyces sp. SLBN-31]
MDEGKPTKPKWWNRTGRQASADADGDFELQRPAVPGADGDFELQRPRDTAAAEGVPEPEGPDAPGVRGDADAARAAETPAAGQAPEAPAAPAADFAPAATAAPAPPVELRKPLHDPDPYSTPPYGEPGPWAPAPPVQHPATPTPHGASPAAPPHGAATPAHGTAAPTPHGAATPAHGAAPPAPHGTAALAPHGAAVPALHGTATPAAAPPVQPPAATPAHGAVPPAPHGAAVPALHGTATPAAAPPVQPPAATPAHGTTTPAPHGTAAPAPPADPGPQPVAPGADAVPQGPPGVAQAPSADPWRNYDPWAQPPTPGPLQQTGASLAGGPPRRGRRVLVLGALVLALVAGSVGGVIGAYLERNGGVGAVELPQAGKEPAGRAPDSVAGIAARALPSVVTLHVTGAEESGTGTGFVLDGLGDILTNNHVVEPAKSGGRITVTFNSGDTAKATVVGRDSGYDLAVVKVSGVRGLKPMPLGNSDNVQVGDPVVAIGAPFDLAGTVTSGIISAKERPITAGGDSADGTDVSYVDALQTDAPINPGNSGGPLLDSRARVIGINSAIRSADDGSDSGSGQAGSIGLGFAIPVNQAKRVAEELINTGHATHPVIGVTLDMSYTGDGARVGTKASGGGPAVTTGGPGDKAGIEPGDVITAVDGQRVHSGEELIVKTRAHRPGDRLEVTLRRDGKEKRISLVLGSSGSG